VGTTRTRSNAVLVEHVRRSRTRVFCSIGWRRGNGRRSGIASGHWPTPDHSICEERSRDMKLRWLSPARSCEFATPWYVSVILVGGLPYASGRGAHFIRRLLWFVTQSTFVSMQWRGGEELSYRGCLAKRPYRRPEGAPASLFARATTGVWCEPRCAHWRGTRITARVAAGQFLSATAPSVG